MGVLAFRHLAQASCPHPPAATQPATASLPAARERDGSKPRIPEAGCAARRQLPGMRPGGSICCVLLQLAAAHECGRCTVAVAPAASAAQAQDVIWVDASRKPLQLDPGIPACPAHCRTSTLTIQPSCTTACTPARQPLTGCSSAWHPQSSGWWASRRCLVQCSRCHEP